MKNNNIHNIIIIMNKKKLPMRIENQEFTTFIESGAMYTFLQKDSGWYLNFGIYET